MASTHAGTLKSTSINGVKLYSLTGNKYVAPWVLAKTKRSLRKDKEYQRRLDLIHDLRFETATTKINVTPDEQYVIASGIYPPQVKVYELKELSMKFERHLISEIVNFQILGDDYSKLVFLCADRSVNLHAKYGSHYSLRIPRMGRDMAYDCWSCDLLCAASSPDLYRINLEQGRFLASLSSQSPGINVVTRSKIHGLVASGGEDGAVECFDMRKKSSVGRINIPAVSSEDYNQEVTSLRFDEDQGYLIAVGSSTGKDIHSLLYCSYFFIPMELWPMLQSPVIVYHRLDNRIFMCYGQIFFAQETKRKNCIIESSNLSALLRDSLLLF